MGYEKKAQGLVRMKQSQRFTIHFAKLDFFANENFTVLRGFVTVCTNYEKNLIKENNLRTFLYVSLKLSSPLSFYVCFVLEKCVCKKLNFFLIDRKMSLSHTSAFFV